MEKYGGWGVIALVSTCAHTSTSCLTCAWLRAQENVGDDDGGGGDDVDAGGDGDDGGGGDDDGGGDDKSNDDDSGQHNCHDVLRDDSGIIWTGFDEKDNFFFCPLNTKHHKSES